MPVRILVDDPLQTTVSSKARKSQPAADFVPWVGFDASASNFANSTSTLSLITFSQQKRALKPFGENCNFGTENYCSMIDEFNDRYHKPPTLIHRSLTIRVLVLKPASEVKVEYKPYRLVSTANKIHRVRNMGGS